MYSLNSKSPKLHLFHSPLFLSSPPLPLNSPYFPPIMLLPCIPARQPVVWASIWWHRHMLPPFSSLSCFPPAPSLSLFNSFFLHHHTSFPLLLLSRSLLPLFPNGLFPFPPIPPSFHSSSSPLAAVTFWVGPSVFISHTTGSRTTLRTQQFRSRPADPWANWPHRLIQSSSFMM